MAVDIEQISEIVILEQTITIWYDANNAIKCHFTNLICLNCLNIIIIQKHNSVTGA